MSTLNDNDLFVYQEATSGETKSVANNNRAALQDDDLFVVWATRDGVTKNYKVRAADVGTGGGGSGDPVISVNCTMTATNGNYYDSNLSATEPTVINGTKVLSHPAWYKDDVAIPGETNLNYTATASGTYKYEERWVGTNGVSVYPKAEVTIKKSEIVKPSVLSPGDGAGEGIVKDVYPRTAVPTVSLLQTAPNTNYWNITSAPNWGGYVEDYSKMEQRLDKTWVRVFQSYSSSTAAILTQQHFADTTTLNGTSDKLVITDCEAYPDDTDSTGTAFCIGIATADVSSSSNNPGETADSLGWIITPKTGNVQCRRYNESNVDVTISDTLTRYDIWEIDIVYNENKARLWRNGTLVSGAELLLNSFPSNRQIYGFSCGNGSTLKLFAIGMGKTLHKLTFTDSRMFSPDNVVIGGLTVSTAFSSGDAIDLAPNTTEASSGIVYGKPTNSELIFHRREATITKIESPDDTTNYKGLAYAFNKFFACGENGKIISSEDGVEWKIAGDIESIKTKEGNAKGYHALTVGTVGGNPRLVACGNSDDAIAWTDDGENWNRQTFPLQGQSDIEFRDITWGNGKFVMVSPKGANEINNIYYSDNGTNWNLASNVGSDSRWFAADFANNRFLIVGWQDQQNAAYSDDGINWTLAPTPAKTFEGKDVALGGPDLNGSCYSPELDRWVTVADTDNMRIWYSDDNCVTWEPASLNYPKSSYYCAAWTGKYFVCGAYQSSENDQSNYHLYSVDGITWEYIPNEFVGWQDCIYADNKLVVAGGNVYPSNSGRLAWGNVGVMTNDFGITNQYVVARTKVTAVAPDPDTLEFTSTVPTIANGRIDNDDWGNATWTVTNTSDSSVQTEAKAIVPGAIQKLTVGNDITLKKSTNYEVTVTYDANDSVSTTSDANSFRTDGPIAAFGNFSSTKYNGNGGTQSVETGVDNTEKALVWIKGRFGGGNRGHALFDTLRGPGKWIGTNSSNTENSGTADLTSFDAKGFTTANTSGQTNGSGESYVAWNFAAAENFFDVITWDGTGDVKDVPHNLKMTPGFVMAKRRDGGGSDWYCESPEFSNQMKINDPTDPNIFLSTAILSAADTTKNIRVSANINTAGTKSVAYLFANNPTGGIKTGQYTVIYNTIYPENIDPTQGATAQNPKKITTGFKPGWIMIKKTSGSGNWLLFDRQRGNWYETYPSGQPVWIMSANSDAQDSQDVGIATYEDGFGVGDNGLAQGTYFYVAIADSVNTDVFFNTNTRETIRGFEIVGKYGVDPTTLAARKLGFAELTKQPTVDTVGYELQWDGRYKPIDSNQSDVDRLEALMISVATEWQYGATYNTGDIVKFNCSLWRAKKDTITTKTPTARNLDCWENLRIECERNDHSDLIPDDWSEEQRRAALQELLDEMQNDNTEQGY